MLSLTDTQPLVTLNRPSISSMSLTNPYCSLPAIPSPSAGWSQKCILLQGYHRPYPFLQALYTNFSAYTRLSFTIPDITKASLEVDYFFNFWRTKAYTFVNVRSRGLRTFVIWARLCSSSQSSSTKIMSSSSSLSSTTLSCDYEIASMLSLSRSLAQVFANHSIGLFTGKSCWQHRL